MLWYDTYIYTYMYIRIPTCIYMAFDCPKNRNDGLWPSQIMYIRIPTWLYLAFGQNRNDGFTKMHPYFQHHELCTCWYSTRPPNKQDRLMIYLRAYVYLYTYIDYICMYSFTIFLWMRAPTAPSQRRAWRCRRWGLGARIHKNGIYKYTVYVYIYVSLIYALWVYTHIYTCT